MKQSIERARSYSPLLKAQQNKLTQVEFDRRSALGSALPNISASYEIQNFLQKPTFNGFSLNSDFERTAGLTISQSLFSFGAVSNAIKAANAAIDMAKLNKEVSSREIEYSVKLSFYSIQLAEKQVEIAKESLENAKTNLSVLQNYFASGRPPRQDLIRLQADVASRSSQVQEVESGYRQAKMKFKILLGLPISQDVNLIFDKSSRYPKLSGEILRKSRLTEQPHIQSLQKQIEYSEKVTEAQYSKIYPTIGAFYNFSTSARSNNNLFATDSTINSSAVGLSVNWSIWNGGTNRTVIRKANAIKIGAEIEKKRQIDVLLHSLQEKVIEYRTLKSNLKNDSASVKLANESYKLSQKKFRTGKTSVTELNSTEALLYQTMLNKALHEFQLRDAFATINRIVSLNGGL